MRYSGPETEAGMVARKVEDGRAEKSRKRGERSARSAGVGWR